MRAQRQRALLGAFAVSALVLSACSSGSSESASPAAASLAAGSAAAVETAGDYKIGDTGPGGGIVFYDAGSDQLWGRFLEAGPKLAPAEWCDVWELDVTGTKETIGAGAANTELIAAACGAGAAKTVSDYDGGGKTDWFLPSKDELNELYRNRDTVGGFGSDYYWSSSQLEAGFAWPQDFAHGNQPNYSYTSIRTNALGVRPVRAF